MDNFLLRTFFSNPPPFPSLPTEPQNLTFFKMLSTFLFIELETWGLFYFVHILALYISTIRWIEFVFSKNNNNKNIKKFNFS